MFALVSTHLQFFMSYVYKNWDVVNVLSLKKKKKTIAQYEISEINSSVSSMTSRTWHVYSCRQCIQRRHCTDLKMQMQTSLTTPSHDFWLEICTLQTPLVLSTSILQQ